jgi:hypothetical protein
LSQLDYHLDGAAPAPAATGATARKVDMATAVAYAVRVIYAAGRLADELPGGGRLFRDVFDPVSGFVVSRMHRDHTERYSQALLDTAHRDLDEYLTSDNSRLCASGYWEVMVRGPFAGRALTPPEELISVVRRLRTLRQAVDEIADFREDIGAGLITTPLLFALEGNPDPDRTRSLIRRLWRSRNTPPGTIDDQLLAELISEVSTAGGFDRAARYADAIWKEGTRLSERDLGPRAHGFTTLLDLKRAKLAELLAARAW